jgi:hypothetical protein
MITIFTPTYNRAYSLPRLYESLKKQTYNNFEWMLINDGSTDNTDEIIKSWLNDNIITINYIKQENGGKHRAINKGLEFIYQHIKEIKHDSSFAGICGTRCYPNSECH